MYAGSFSLLKKSFRTGTNSWHSSHLAEAKNSNTMRFSRIPTISRSVLSSSWSQLFSTRHRFRNRSTMTNEKDEKGSVRNRFAYIGITVCMCAVYHACAIHGLHSCSLKEKAPLTLLDIIKGSPEILSVITGV